VPVLGSFEVEQDHAAVSLDRVAQAGRPWDEAAQSAGISHVVFQSYAPQLLKGTATYCDSIRGNSQASTVAGAAEAPC